jgi:hypothetical protein
MAPHSQSQAATAGKRKKADKPGKALAVKSTNPVSKKTHKHKKQRPAAAAADEPAGGGVLLSAALPPARQLEFFLRSFERAAKMRLSPLELAAYSGTYVRIRANHRRPWSLLSNSIQPVSCARLAGL